jgi:homoserine dehydrogenase
MGVLNGTTNFILEKMADGNDYGEALGEAQRLGYAEADPTLDVNGADAADKLAILMRLTFGLSVDRKKFPVVGIDGLSKDVLADADRLGYRVKLVAAAEEVEDGVISARVSPTFVAKGTEFAAIPGALNAVMVDSTNLGTTLFQGPGAGGAPTGNAVVADIIEAARHLRAGIVPGTRHIDANVGLLPAEDGEARYYMRISVEDRAGVLAAITQVLGEEGISLETVLQREQGSATPGPVPIVVTTFRCRHGAVQAATKALRRMRRTVKEVVALPIETR